MMSRQHARVVTMGAGEYIVEDLGSRNGTWIDGRSVRHERLTDGAIFETGRTAWLFRRAPKGAPEHVPIGPTRSFSPRIQALVAQLESLAPAAVSLLLVGETGTGKEVFARELHARSGRRGKFIAVNCGALTESLLESELFGHTRGAFTGASADRAGLVEAADHGTLFLDEIGEMPASVQVRLLRVLQEGEVVPVGATAPRKVDVRVVAATHRNLLQMVEERAFREDLYARLEGWVLPLPALADRREDVGELVAHAVRMAGLSQATATLRAARALLAFDWPFNVRQLLKGTEAALALARGERIEFEHLPERIRAGAARRPRRPAPRVPNRLPTPRLRTRRSTRRIASYGSASSPRCEPTGQRDPCGRVPRQATPAAATVDAPLRTARRGLRRSLRGAAAPGRYVAPRVRRKQALHPAVAPPVAPGPPWRLGEIDGRWDPTPTPGRIEAG